MEYHFDTFVEYNSIENNISEYFMLSEKSDVYFMSIKNNPKNEIKGSLIDFNTQKIHFFEIFKIQQNFDFRYIKSEKLSIKNKTFIDYNFELNETKIDSTTTEIKLFKHKNQKKNKLEKAFDLIYDINSININEQFLNRFCHGYFSNTEFKLTIPLPKSITVYSQKKTSETFKLKNIEKINTQLLVKE
ncbi:MAG: hypothetical protein ACK4RM_05165 [Flavobacterium sp.]